MRVVVTGAAGFLGSRLADHLLGDESPIPVSELVLVDAVKPAARSDPRVSTYALDITAPDAASTLVTPSTGAVYHLAAIVSGHAEKDFDLGFAVNFDATRALLEAARRSAPSVKFIFASTVGVYGGELPPVVDETVAVAPQTSYGAAKAASELLVLDYSRRGFVDGRVLRLPTVSVRGGTANAAVTSYASGLVREPLAGVKAVIPVPPEQGIWLSSPRAVVRNIARAAVIPKPGLLVNLPGMCVTTAEMLSALRSVAGDAVAALVSFELDERIAKMVATFPINFDDSRALRLGFETDSSFADIIKDYMRNDLKMNV